MLAGRGSSLAPESRWSAKLALLYAVLFAVNACLLESSGSPVSFLALSRPKLQGAEATEGDCCSSGSRTPISDFASAGLNGDTGGCCKGACCLVSAARGEGEGRRGESLEGGVGGRTEGCLVMGAEVQLDKDVKDGVGVPASRQKKIKHGVADIAENTGNRTMVADACQS